MKISIVTRIVAGIGLYAFAMAIFLQAYFYFWKVIPALATLAEAMDLEVAPTDPFEEAVSETEKAINLVAAGTATVDLSPASSAIRRYQHQMARQANLVSHSYGKEPRRHVRIFNTRRNQ